MINNIKNVIRKNIGNRIFVKYNEGRNKIFFYSGVIVEVYDNVFIIVDDCNFYKRCFSYYDILIKKAKISFKL